MALKKGMTVMQTGAEKSHLYREMKKAHGLCTFCGCWESVEGSRVYCEPHAELNRRKYQNWIANQSRKGGSDGTVNGIG